MATRLTMPKLGMTMEQGTVHAWFKEEGDPVEEGERLLSVLTDKIDIEVDAPATGVLRKILVAEGETVPINTPIAIIASPDADISHWLDEDIDVEMTVDPGTGADERTVTGAPAAAAARRVRATPVARQIARERGLDLAVVPGTGPRGRVTRGDVEEYVARTGAAATSPLPAESVAPAAATSGAVPTTSAMVPDTLRGTNLSARRIPFTGVRRLIADRMTASAFSAPHVTLMTEVDVTELIELRSTLNDADRTRGGDGISFVDLFAVIAARALTILPQLNARLDGDHIVIENDVHIGIAVAVPDGLIVPVIRDVAELSVGAVARRRVALVKSARDGSLTPDAVSGGTFTITNLGAYDIDGFTPIINPPQTAILGMRRVVEKPAVYAGDICARSMMTLSLSFDHRVVDGAPAAAFLQSIKGLAERPALLHL